MLVANQPWAPRSTRIVLPRSRLPSPTWSTCICGLHCTYLSLGFYHNYKSWPGKVGTTCSASWWRNARALRMTGRYQTIKFKISGSHSGCRGSCPGPGGDPEPGPVHRDSHLWDFLEDEVELIKDNHLNSLWRQAPGRTGWGFPERLTLSWTKRSPEKHPLSPAAASGPLDSFLRLCLQPKSRLTKQQKKCKQ